MSESRLILGDCFVELAGLPDASIDSLVTDPPYGINFMGKAWDGAAIQQQAEQKRRETRQHLRLTGSPDSPSRKLIERSGSAFQNRAGEAGAYDFSVTGNRAFQAWVEQWARECLRVLKPGGFALVFGGTRTAHRLACGLEDAGFEIRDEILAWMFGSGFPKSLDVSKAIDKSLGAERERVAGPVSGGMASLNAGNREHGYRDDAYYENGNAPLSNDAVTDDARNWQGWGTALKPAHEPIIVARKPLQGTVASNVLAHGTGGLNIDGCRIAGAEPRSYPNGPGGKSHHYSSEKRSAEVRPEPWETNAAGRWPANVVLVHHEDCVEVGTAVLRGDQRETGNGTRAGG